jgi:hypothetical protein
MSTSLIANDQPAVPDVETVESCEIGDAIAILMSRYPITYTKAFAAMLASSERTQRSMPELAVAIIRTDERRPDVAGRRRVARARSVNPG